MTNLDAAILNSSDRIELVARREHAICIEQLAHLAHALESKIDEIRNQFTTPEISGGGVVNAIRVDEVSSQWEAVFSVINMASGPILQLALRGLYLQAICLIRQEYEGIAQLSHIARGTRNESRAPHIGPLEDEIKPWYGELSEGAHISSDAITQLQSVRFGGDDQIVCLPYGASLIPCYNQHTTSVLLEMHVKLRGELLKLLTVYVEKCDRPAAG